jgi:hypothetical protein
MTMGCVAEDIRRAPDHPQQPAVNTNYTSRLVIECSLDVGNSPPVALRRNLGVVCSCVGRPAEPSQAIALTTDESIDFIIAAAPLDRLV